MSSCITDMLDADRLNIGVNMETIQTYGEWQLNKYSKLKYFKNGRANMHVEITYCIEHGSRFVLQCDDVNRVETGMFWIPTKREAMVAWTALKRTNSLNGCTLRTELFPKAGA